MRRWLFSPDIKRRTQEQNWPTAETASLWKEFVQSLNRSTLDKWEEKNFDVAIQWTNTPLRTGAPVRIKNGKEVFSMKWDFVGELRQRVVDTGGIFIAHVSSNGRSITGQYMGPRG